ncbi:MAG: hypothetical protein QNJ90_15520 [Planctomycetota bacterium]|nr:hypothetical protein [Planctomycetota bacterium]
MARRVRHPMVSFAMFLIVVGMGFVVWENRNMLKGEAAGELMDQTTRADLQDQIYETFESDDCFMGLRSNINWRPNEQRYRLDIEVADGQSCERGAKVLCEQIAHLIKDQTQVIATVIAFDAAGREVGRFVM